MPKHVFNTDDLPDFVQVLGRKLTIRLIEDEVNDGYWDQATGTIEIQRGLYGERLLEVLLHELLHAFYSLNGLNKGSTEERVVSCLAVGLAEFVVAYLPLLKRLEGRIVLGTPLNQLVKLRAANRGGEALCAKHIKGLHRTEREQSLAAARADRKALIVEALKEFFLSHPTKP